MRACPIIKAPFESVVLERRRFLAQEQARMQVVYVAVKQLSARYGVHPVTIWRWARDGYLPKPHRIGPRTTRWRLDEIEAADAAKALRERRE